MSNGRAAGGASGRVGRAGARTQGAARALQHGSCAYDTAGWHPRHGASEGHDAACERAPGRACASRLGVLAGSVGPSWCTVHLAQF